MANSNIPNNTTALSQDQKVMAGVDKYLANVGQLTFLGTSYTPATLKAVFQGDIDGRNALDTSRAQVKQQVVAMQASRTKVLALRAALRGYILSTYGQQAVQMLQDFGMTVPKARSVSAATKAESAAKASATRKAREKAAQAVAPAPATTPQVQTSAPTAQVTAAAQSTPHQ